MPCCPRLLLPSHPRSRSLAALLVGALLFGSCSDSEPTADRPRDILLITIDTLRADHLGLYGYGRETSPNIDRWFRDGKRFERAYSTEASTSPSVTSMLSGLLPQDHGVRLFFQLVPDDLMLLPDLLPEEYQSAAIVSNMVLTDEAMGFGGRFDYFDDRVDQRESDRRVFERNGAGTTNAALRWMANERDPLRPTFLWVHYIDPHGPYRPPEDAPKSFEHEGSQAIDAKRLPRYSVLAGVEDALTYVDRYDAEIAYADREVNRLLEAFGQIHDLDESLLILTSDHGESMTDHERWFAHTYQVYEEIAHVPLLIRAPGTPASTESGLASGVDIARTILNFAGATSPARSPGLDLLSPTPIPQDRTVFVEATLPRGQWRAAIHGEQKWFVQLRGRKREVLEQRFYDLSTDRRELSPQPWQAGAAPALDLMSLVASDPDPAGIPEQYERGLMLDAPKVAPRVNADQLEGLRALGYAE